MNFRARAFLYAIVSAAVLAEVTAMGFGRWTIDPARALVVVGLGALAYRYPLEIAPRNKATASVGVFFAAVLLFSPAQAAGLVAIAIFVGLVGFGLGPRTSSRTIAFNTAGATLATLLAGVALQEIDRTGPAAGFGGHTVLGALTAGLTIFVFNTALVTVMTWLQTGRRPGAVLARAVSGAWMQTAGLLLVGWAAAILIQQALLLALVVVLPAILIQLSLKRTLELAHQTVGAVEALADIVDQRDRSTYEHSSRVARLSEAIAVELGMPADRVAEIRLAARVHDIGKVAVPDRVLLKAGPLNDEEWELMRQHPQVGHDILARFPLYTEGRELVLDHHERADGSGYPRGLTGRRLSVAAQVIGVADSYDAMTSCRPYRDAMSPRAAVSDLRRLSDRFEPRVIDALARVVGQELTASAAATPRTLAALTTA